MKKILLCLTIIAIGFFAITNTANAQNNNQTDKKNQKIESPTAKNNLTTNPLSLTRTVTAEEVKEMNYEQLIELISDERKQAFIKGMEYLSAAKKQEKIDRLKAIVINHL